MVLRYKNRDEISKQIFLALKFIPFIYFIFDVHQAYSAFMVPLKILSCINLLKDCHKVHHNVAQIGQ